MKLSIVIPIYNEEDLIEELLLRVEKTMSSLGVAFEVIVIDDGSMDRSLEILKNCALKKYPMLKVVSLSRNFGQQSAYMAGLSQVKGNAVVLMDGDLQDPPEVIPEMFAEWEKGYKVVVGARKSRHESMLRRFLFMAFHRFFSFLSDYPMPLNAGMFSLIDRHIADQLLNLSERNRFIPGLRDWMGFDRTVVWYDRHDRWKGSPKQTLSRLIKLGCDAIFSFSYKPLRLCLFFGIITSISSFLYAIVLVTLWFYKINYVKGFTTITVSIFFLSGIILISIGIMGEYLGRIYDEVKSRPLYFIADVYTSEQNKING